MKTLIPYLIAILATIGIVLLFIQNRDLKSNREQIKHQQIEITRKLDVKTLEQERLKAIVIDLTDSLELVQDGLSLQSERERDLIRDYERRLLETEELTDNEVDSFLITNYPDSRDIVRDLVAFQHCKELVLNKDGTIKILERKVNLQNKVILTQDSIIANLNDRLMLKDQFIDNLGKDYALRVKQVKRQRNTAYGVAGGMLLLAIAAFL